MTMALRFSRYGQALGLAVAFAVAAPAVAQTADPAAVPVKRLSDGLLAIMKAGSAAGIKGRSNLIGPVVDGSLDLSLMTRLVVGAPWAKAPAADQAAVTAAFRRMTIARYASNFKSFGGESFVVDPKVEARGPDRLVHTRLMRGRADPVVLDYRLRQTGDQWRIIDIYYQSSISQIATQRADFARILASGGLKGLAAHLNQLAAQSAN
jgi:phospholipid transport system substrate-binding protein